MLLRGRKQRIPAWAPPTTSTSSTVRCIPRMMRRVPLAKPPEGSILRMSITGMPTLSSSLCGATSLSVSVCRNSGGTCTASPPPHPR